MAMASASQTLVDAPPYRGWLKTGPAPGLRPLRSLVSSARCSASFAERVRILSARSGRLLSQATAELAAIPVRCPVKPMRPGPAGQEQPAVPGNLGLRICSRGVGLASGLGQEGEWPRRESGSPAPCCQRAEDRLGAGGWERGGCGRARQGRGHLLSVSVRAPELLIFKASQLGPERDYASEPTWRWWLPPLSPRRALAPLRRRHGARGHLVARTAVPRWLRVVPKH